MRRPRSGLKLHKLARTLKRYHLEITECVAIGTHNGHSEAVNPRDQRRQTLSPRLSRPCLLPGSKSCLLPGGDPAKLNQPQ